MRALGMGTAPSSAAGGGESPSWRAGGGNPSRFPASRALLHISEKPGQPLRGFISGAVSLRSHTRRWLRPCPGRAVGMLGRAKGSQWLWGAQWGGRKGLVGLGFCRNREQTLGPKMWGALGGLCARVGYGGGERILWVVGGQCGRRDVPVPPVPSPPAMGSPGVRAGSLQSGDTQGWGKRELGKVGNGPLGDPAWGGGEKKSFHGAFPSSSRASWSSTSAGSSPARGRWRCRSAMPSWKASPSSCTGSASSTSARR